MSDQQAESQDKVKVAGTRPFLQGGGEVYSECNGKQSAGFDQGCDSICFIL